MPDGAMGFGRRTQDQQWKAGTAFDEGGMMTEIGNMMFGNSRGSYHVPRGAGWEDELVRLFDTCAPDRDSSWREYGSNFENETFLVMQYWWGYCTCGFDEVDNFTEAHSDTCYQAKLKEEKLKAGGFENEWGYISAPVGESFVYCWDTIYKNITDEFNLPMQGCAVHCTCDYDARYAAYIAGIGYADGHKKQCGLVKPNFLHKPTEFEIQWYKYPLRDSYMNQNITLLEFKNIITQCISSLEVT